MEKYYLEFCTIYYEPQDKEYLPLYEDACRKSIMLLKAFDGLSQPAHCRVFIMRSWKKLLFYSDTSPFGFIMSMLSYPMWYIRNSKRWSFIGGFSIPLRNAIGVKPPPVHTFPEAIRDRGAQANDKNMERRIQTAICHEFSHLYVRKLLLPLWLNEGFALLVGDCFVGIQTMRPITIAFLKEYTKKRSTKYYKSRASNSLEEISYQYIRGYWMMRYLLRDHPQAFTALFQKRRSKREMEHFLAKTIGIPHTQFWQEIDNVLAKAFPIGFDLKGYPPITLAKIMQGDAEN
jgi:hypothetical protein